MNCGFCGCEIPPGTGKIFVRKTGKSINFCSNKCDKNMIKLGRIPRKVRWTDASKAFRKIGTAGKLEAKPKESAK